MNELTTNEKSAAQNTGRKDTVQHSIFLRCRRFQIKEKTLNEKSARQEADTTKAQHIYTLNVKSAGDREQEGNQTKKKHDRLHDKIKNVHSFLNENASHLV